MEQNAQDCLHSLAIAMIAGHDFELRSLVSNAASTSDGDISSSGAEKVLVSDSGATHCMT